MPLLSLTADAPNPKLEALGFRFGTNGPHAARTMMLGDLMQLFGLVPPDAERAAYIQAVVTENVLAKPTQKARELSARHLTALYGLDLGNPIFRALRRLWSLNEQAQPTLALLVALARDPLLRLSAPWMAEQPVGSRVERTAAEQLLERACAGRFSPRSRVSFAQNINGTWTSAGFLSGRTRKVRVQPELHPETAVLASFLAHLEGLSGSRLLRSDWLMLFAHDEATVERALTAAAHRGQLVFMNAGGVKELRFPGYLTPEEDRIRHEVAHEL